MLSRVLGIIALVVTFASILGAQNADATLTGYVKDPSGAAVPKAKIILKNSATGVAATTQTNGTGIYTFPYVAPGVYEISVNAAGFQTRRSEYVCRVEELRSGDFAGEPATADSDSSKGTLVRRLQGVWLSSL